MNETIIDRVTSLAKAKGEKPNVSFKAAGVGKNFFYDLRQNKKPSIEKIEKLATYFSVSTDYIIGNEKTAAQDEPPLDDKRQELMDISSDFTEDEFIDLLNYIDLVKRRRKQ